ncbi:MAG TPA: polymer-forming cytoskeletal protein [Nitrolancea sp.]|nr:polymer-forming cytoskeletal protein [Nitrolancea sp.]
MSRKHAFVVFLVSLVLALLPLVALAADGTNDSGELLLRINGPVTVSQNETHDAVIVISDNATVDGTVTSALLVIDGDAVVSGRVDGDVTVVNGTLTLASTAQVKNVSSVRGNLNQDPAATVSGKISRSDLVVDAWVWGVISAILWIGMTIAVLAGGLIYAAIAGRQLKATGDLIVSQPGPTLLAAALLWIALPLLMAAVIATIVGIPFGLGYFLVVLPVVWFLGYLVAGTQLGRLIMGRRRDAERPYLAALLGLLLLQVLGLIPWLGVFSFLAGIVGAGALALMAWHAWRKPGARPAPRLTQGPTPSPGG